MALPENVANSSTPGAVTALGTLTAEVTAIATKIKVSAKPPAALEAAGQFHIVIGSEILLVTAGQTTTEWTVTRGVEGTTGAIHANGVSVFHFLTAEALQWYLAKIPRPTNPILNPSFEYDVVGAAPAAWALSSSAEVTEEEFKVSETWSASGKKSLHVKAKHPAGVVLKHLDIRSSASLIPVTPDTLCSASAVLKIISAATGQGFLYSFIWLKADKVTVISEATSSAQFIGETGEKTLLATSTAAPAEAAFCVVALLAYSNVANASFEFYVDSIIAARGTTVPPYFDGDNEFAEWEGTPGESVSLAGVIRTNEIKKEAVNEKKLIKALQEKLNPTAWENLTLGAKVEAGGGQVPAARAEDGKTMVRLRGRPKIKAGEELKIGETLATIPAGLRPIGTIQMPVQLGAAIGYLTITEAGVITASAAVTAGLSVGLDAITYNLT